MLLLPLHRPVRVAEDVAVLDNIANGRVIVGVAAGYRPIEFEGLEETRKGREARMEEQLEILIKAWTTDSFAHRGKHYQFPEISVMPKPAQKPHPPIWIWRFDRGRLSPSGEMGGRALLLAAPSSERPQESLRELSALPG